MTAITHMTSKHQKAGGQPRRILYLIDGLEGDGAERQFCELIKGVDPSDDYEVHVGVLEVNENGHAWILEERGITVNVFARQYRFDLSPIRHITKYIRKQNIDLVHAYLSMGSEFGLVAAKLTGIPVITSSIRDGKNRDWREAIRTYYQSVFADLAVANSQAGFNTRFKKMRPSFRVVYNGFDLTRFEFEPSQRDSLYLSLGVDKDTNLVCMAARMQPQKEQGVLIDAMAEVLKAHPNTVLLLAGEGELRQELEEQCARLGIENSVRFLGHRRDVEAILSISHVAVLLTNTDIHHEGISNTIIESMAVGSAVIATRGGGTDEILGDSDLGGPPYSFGIKVDAHNSKQVADGISYYLEQPQARLEIAKRGQEMVRQRFNLERFISENIALYEEIFAGKVNDGLRQGDTQ